MAFSKKERTGENAKPLGSARRWGAPATGTDDRSGTGSAVTNGAERPSWGVQELASSSSPKKSEYTDSHTSGPNGATAPGWDDDSVVHHIGETSHYGGSGLSSKSSNSRAIQREDWSRLDYGDTVYSRGNESRWSNSLSREPCYRNQKGRTGENVTALGVHGCWGGNVEGQQRVADTDEDAGQENPQEVGPISTQRDGAETSTQIMPAQHPIQSIHAPSHPNGTAKKQERQAAMPSAKAIAITGKCNYSCAHLHVSRVLNRKLESFHP
ncbi:hypothetical protein K437DRAFT_195078 [Tilletiaria anomala UBC 951]|uniref:Uncharacterized protein n=1 Tax=Tilletiaria anomala (strain ATCC 24038 / CBS 436.72 / UBC 951) TaxID=1037660 RepID=A0A066VMS5_TILAU|nr:uncharacterized protein K437DRAFT_195078 [Tilletiaria anomala UBC 951]KDN39840.1 hypothetical protein K437DRAFT_195078 [Tilletiaria anomala UBC 951]